MKDQTMQPDYSDETLMAFADGTLDEPLFSAVADAVEQDPSMAARLELLVNGADLARTGFETMLEPVPPALAASVRDAIKRSERQSRLKQFMNWSWALPISGLAAAAAIVVTMVPMQMGAQTGGVLAPLSQAELTAALDILPAGETQPLANGATLQVIATFTDANGTLCREFDTAGYVAIACRNEAAWRVTFAMANPTADEGYRPASGLAAIDNYLDAIGASAPLLDGDEAAALAGATTPIN